MKKSILFLAIIAVTIICLFACEKPTVVIQTIPDNDSITISNDTINYPDTIVDILQEERTVVFLYIVNHLDNDINIEIHRDSINLKDEYWIDFDCIKTLKLSHNDTVYLDSVIYYYSDKLQYFEYPGTLAAKAYSNICKSIKIDYNNNQYKYSDSASITKLLSPQNYWYFVIGDDDKKYFNWK